MFNSTKRKQTVSTSGETSLIAHGTQINGDVCFDGNLHLDGRVEGTVRADQGSDAVLTLSEMSEVKGEIYVANAIINGQVHGNIHAYQRLELAPNARIEGDVHYRLLEIAAGAQVNGRMVHTTEAPYQLSGPQAELGCDVQPDSPE